MGAKEIAAQFEQLPLAAQRLVAELIEKLGRPAGSYGTWEELTAVGQPTEAILLPPVDTEPVPDSWPANRFMEPTQFHAWADRTDITDSTEFVRQLRRAQWG